MEKTKIRMKSKVAASNLLKALHSLYQLGHFCDVTVRTDCPGSQKDFFVHKAVLAASSNYFKSLFLKDEMLNAKNCNMTLQDVDTEEFVSFLKFVYTTEVEIEVGKLHRLKVVAEKLECKDLLGALEEIKFGGQEESDLSVCLKRPEMPLGNQAKKTGDQEQRDLSQTLATPMTRNLWDRNNHVKESATCDVSESKFGQSNKDGLVAGEPEEETATSASHYKGEKPDIHNTGNVTQEENKPINQVNSTCIVSRMLPGQDDENYLILSGVKVRKSPHSVSKILTQTYTCDVCDRSFRFAKQYQSHMELEHDLDLAIKYRCHVCGMLFVSCQTLKQHRFTVHNDERHFPRLCEKKVQHTKDVDDHIRRVQEKKQSPQICPYCDKVINSKCGLTVHVRMHTGEKPYKCEFCPASFAQGSTYTAHMRYRLSGCVSESWEEEGFQTPASLMVEFFQSYADHNS